LRTLEKQPEDATRTRIIRNATLALEKTHHLDAMVGVLLDVARLSRGQMQLDCQEFALNELLGAIVERLTESAASVGCELRLHLDAEHRGVWDRVRLQQVITNLIANALKFGARKPIEIAVRKLSNGIEIAVTDQGPGIAPEHQAQLFQQFTRFASTKNYGGLGLGLWISKEIVRAHGGTIRVQSQLGHGASFVVELPNRTHPAARQSAEPQNEVSL
jgi:signal transduction histidine kinase